MNIAMKPLSMDSPANMMTSNSANTIRAEYSGGPKLTATLAITGARKVRPITPMVPAMNEAMAAIPSAFPARPCLAIS